MDKSSFHMTTNIFHSTSWTWSCRSRRAIWMCTKPSDCRFIYVSTKNLKHR